MKNFIYYLYFTFVFLLLMLGPHAWFMWIFDTHGFGIYRNILYVMASFVSLVYCYTNKVKLLQDTYAIIGFVALFVAIELPKEISLKTIVADLCFIFPLWVLLSDKKNADGLLRKIVIVMAIILIPGIVIHIYLFCGGHFPGIPIIHPGSGLYIFTNYGFVLKGASVYEEDGLRFQSIFLEPGYLGTFMSFLLYSIQFDFKKYRVGWVLLLSLALSLSLAGYVLCFLGYIFIQWSRKKRLSKFIKVGILLAIIFYAGKEYNDGKNLLNEKLLERFDTDQKKGIKGNNRVGDGTNFYFERSMRDGSFLFGIGNKEIDRLNGGKGWTDTADYSTQIRGAGYKIFILRSGLLSALCFLFAYYFIGAKGSKNKRYSCGYLIIVFATFLQAAYPESYSWLIPYVLGIGINDKTILKNRIHIKIHNSLSR